MTLVKGLSSWTLDMPTDYVETTEFNEANKSWVQGLPNIAGQLGGFWDDTETKLSAGAVSVDGVSLLIYPNKSALAKYAQGPAWIDVSFKGAVNSADDITVNYRANGGWTVLL